MIELLFFIFAGCLLGTLTGMVPGIHVNTMSALILLFAFAAGPDGIALIVAMGVTHSFMDFIPSIVLGAPDSESFLAVLPGHRYLLRGKGFRALSLTVTGGLVGGILALALSPFFLLFISRIEFLLPAIIPLVLAAVLASMLFSEKGRRGSAALVLALSGLLGTIVLRAGTIPNPLVPLIIGFFAVATLLHSLRKKPLLREQEVERESVGAGDALQGSFLSVMAGSTVSLMPSIGPAQAAFLVKKVMGKMRTEQYLVLLGGINTVNLIFSFFVLFALGKTRTGVAAAIREIVVLKEAHLALISGAVLIAMCFSVFAALFLGRALLKRIASIPYRALNLSVLGFLFPLVLFLSGFLGVIATAASAAIGYYCIASGIRRTNCMAFLMVPTVIIYLGF